MAVVKVKVEMEVPKELKEIVDAMNGILAHFVQKKPIAEIAAQLPAVMTAVEGWDKVAEEVISDGKDEAAAYLVHKIMGTLLPSAPAE